MNYICIEIMTREIIVDIKEKNEIREITILFFFISFL